MSFCHMLFNSCLSCSFLVVVLVVKIFFRFLKPLSASVYLLCCPTFGRAYRMSCSKALYLLLVPKPRNPCVLPLHSLLQYNSIIHAQASICASYTTNMRSCCTPTSQSAIYFPCSSPSSCCCSSTWFVYISRDTCKNE